MSDSFETVVKNFSGLSSETKPTIAAGMNVPNGSRWREVDTRRWMYYDSATDDWYSMEEYTALISGHAPVVDLRAIAILESCELLLKKIEYHLMIATDTNLNNEDV